LIREAIDWHAANLKSPDERIRCAAAEALTRFGRDAHTAVPALRQALEMGIPEDLRRPCMPWEDARQRVQEDALAAVRTAIKALGEIGPDARDAFDTLRQLEERNRFGAADCALEAMKRINSAATAEVLNARRRDAERQRKLQEEAKEKQREAYEAKQNDSQMVWDPH
jgi:hypothetical protein